VIASRVHLTSGANFGPDQTLSPYSAKSLLGSRKKHLLNMIPLSDNSR
jgi:hypothetical protein